MDNKEQYFQVVIPGFALDSLTYKSSKKCNVGSCVIVRLRGYKKVGYVSSKLTDEQVATIKFKTLAIEKVLDDHYSLTEAQLFLAEWMIKFYINPVGLNYELFIPSSNTGSKNSSSRL